MPLRYECDEPDFPGAFVEFSDSWSRKQIRLYWKETKTEEDNDAWFALVKSKIVTMHMVTTEGAELTTGAQLTDETTDEIDVRLWMWFSTALGIAVNEVVALGNALGRRLRATHVKSKDTADRPMN